MVIVNTYDELKSPEKKPSVHSCCASKSCVEVILDGEMQLAYISDQYNPSEQSPIVDLNKMEVTFRQRDSMPENIDEALPAHNQLKIHDQVPANVPKAAMHNPRPNKGNENAKQENEKKLKEASENYKNGMFAEAQDRKGNTGCSSCAQNQERKKAGMLKRLAKGVPGLLKSELGIDQAEPALVDKRKSICLNCPEGIYNFGVCDEERGGCGCFLASKVTIEGESCPKGHW